MGIPRMQEDRVYDNPLGTSVWVRRYADGSSYVDVWGRKAAYTPEDARELGEALIKAAKLAGRPLADDYPQEDTNDA